jgi:hypothetical protein
MHRANQPLTRIREHRRKRAARGSAWRCGVLTVHPPLIMIENLSFRLRRSTLSALSIA